MKKLLFVMVIFFKVICFSFAKPINVNEKVFFYLINWKTSPKFKYSFLASSFLIEKGKTNDEYSASKVEDGNLDTTWAEGVKGDGIDEHLVFLIGTKNINDIKRRNAIMFFHNGFAKNKELFFANNRVKKAKLEIYEAEINITLEGIKLLQKPSLNNIIDLNLKDSMVPQNFIIPLQSKQKVIGKAPRFADFAFIGKLIIKEVYHGTKYQDTCISEIKLRYKGHEN
jgi:hypothetical protein